MRYVAAVIFGLVVLWSTLPSWAEPDAKGSKEHPLLPRLPDFYISAYQYNDFDQYGFIGADKKKVTVEGHKYYLQYNLNKGAAEPGELKIRRNIEDALKKIGGQVVFDDNFNRVSTIVIEKEGKETWVEVRANPKLYRLITVTKEQMKQEIEVTAEKMGTDIQATGHVSIYGIYFDTAKSDLRPESAAAIGEIAKLLKNSPSLKVYIVGHTDNVGSFDANMRLSRDRAEAVTRELIGKYQIAADRLKAHGVSSLAPMASNVTEEGKQKNRRVELVQQ